MHVISRQLVHYGRGGNCYGEKERATNKEEGLWRVVDTERRVVRVGVTKKVIFK